MILKGVFSRFLTNQNIRWKVVNLWKFHEKLILSEKFVSDVQKYEKSILSWFRKNKIDFKKK